MTSYGKTGYYINTCCVVLLFLLLVLVYVGYWRILFWLHGVADFPPFGSCLRWSLVYFVLVAWCCWFSSFWFLLTLVVGVFCSCCMVLLIFLLLVLVYVGCWRILFLLCGVADFPPFVVFLVLVALCC